MFEGGAAVRREAKAEAGDGAVVEAAPTQIFQTGMAVGTAQFLLEEGAGHFHSVIERGGALGPFALFRGLDRHFQSGLTRQFFNCLGEAEMVGLHLEGDDVAMSAAAEAMIEALLLVDREAGRLFIVEGTQTHMLPPFSGKPHLAPNH